LVGWTAFSFELFVIPPSSFVEYFSFSLSFLLFFVSLFSNALLLNKSCIPRPVFTFLGTPEFSKSDNPAQICQPCTNVTRIKPVRINKPVALFSSEFPPLKKKTDAWWWISRLPRVLRPFGIQRRPSSSFVKCR
jgi:hypothetical protein